ncbi:MAG: TAXI family TRAP transporter solute-binding subunit [Gammaproteobacteria bacterium]
MKPPEPSRPDPLWHTLLPVVVLTLAAFAVAYQFVDPAPPKTLTIAAGSPGGAYWRVAHAYQQDQTELKKSGIELHVLETKGSMHNLDLLSVREADVAFVQGGIQPKGDDVGLRAIGSVYYEPLWVFTRGESPSQINELKGKGLAIGSQGSGTRELAWELLRLNGMNGSDARLLPLGGRSAMSALDAGEADAMFMVAGSESELVREMAANPLFQLMSFERAQAYSRHQRYLKPLPLPRGALDLAKDIPNADKQLLAVSANLVAGPDMHPALIDQLLQVAGTVHAEGGVFEQPGEFPSRRYLTLPLHEEARRFYEHGAPLLQRYLPFWAASLVDRLWVMLLPLVAIMIPLMKIMPPLFTWRMRARVYRWYRDLGQVDRDLWEGKLDGLAEEIQRIEQEIHQVSVPLSITDELYDLRVHLDLVRRKLEEVEH